MSKSPTDPHAGTKEVANDLTASSTKDPTSAAVGSSEESAGGLDPYHKWLGIPPREQPPHHYRLLAIDLFESDPDVIDSAAIGRTSHIRQFANGPHAAASQTLLNAISSAQICLLDPKQKSAYDARLKTELDAEAQTNPPVTAAQAEPAKPAADPKLQQQIQKLDKQKQQIESLLDKCEFATAISALEKMAAVKSPKLAKYAKWAQQQIPKAKRGTKEMRESSAAVYRTAAGLFDRNDYEEAAEMLQQIPKKYRDAEFSELLQECLDLQEEIAVLQEDIDHAESLNKYEDLQPTVERLLELKPADRRAKRLLKELKTYGKGGGMRLGGRGDGRFDAAGNTSNPVKVALLVGIPLLLFGLVSWATVIYVRSGDKTIKIEIDDPTAQVSIDGDEIEITGVGDTIKLKPGTHNLIVKRDDIEVHTRRFEVVKGQNPVLRITLAEAVDDPDDADATPTAAPTWDGWPAAAPPPAIAPFDAEQAKQHQAAWAKYFGVPVEYENNIGMKFRLIPPGEFLMGSTPEEVEAALKAAGQDEFWHERINSEGPQHKVVLTQPVYVGVTEVTQAQYEQVMGTNPSHFSASGGGKEVVANLETGNHPVERVSWNDAAEFCAKLSQQEELNPFYLRSGETVTPLDGTGYRLPTEAEWESACRAGTTTRFWSGDEVNDLDSVGWFDKNSGGRTHAAGEKRANPYGLSDVHGNVWEWVQDSWNPAYYGTLPEDVAINPSSAFSDGSQRALRGGRWFHDWSRCRSSARNASPPTSRYDGVGFRVVLVAESVRVGRR